MPCQISSNQRQIIQTHFYFYPVYTLRLSPSPFSITIHSFPLVFLTGLQHVFVQAAKRGLSSLIQPPGNLEGSTCMQRRLVFSPRKYARFLLFRCRFHVTLSVFCDVSPSFLTRRQPEVHLRLPNRRDVLYFLGEGGVLDSHSSVYHQTASVAVMSLGRVAGLDDDEEFCLVKRILGKAR